jgi:holo-[acyl-carrier protein] synthase
VIIGLGSDLCSIERIQAALDRHGDRFEQRCFTAVERAKAAKRPFTRAGTYAKRFAAKEAFSKAVGTGFFRGVYMKDIGVVNLPSGAPTLALENGAAKRLAELTPEGHVAHIHLTLTDDHPWAQAFVVIEARPL